MSDANELVIRFATSHNAPQMASGSGMAGAGCRVARSNRTWTCQEDRSTPHSVKTGGGGRASGTAAPRTGLCQCGSAGDARATPAAALARGTGSAGGVGGTAPTRCFCGTAAPDWRCFRCHWADNGYHYCLSFCCSNPACLWRRCCS